MPIYEYSCSKCEKTFEILVRSQEQKIVCPECGSNRVAKQFSTFAAQSSGSSSQGSDPSCSGNPGSCGRCGTGVPHSH